MSSVIRQRPDFHTLSSSEVLDEFVAMRILDKTTDNAMLHSQRSKKPNLALKAKASVEEEGEGEEEECFPEDTKYAYHEHMALASRQYWSKKNSRPNFNKNNSSGAKGKQRVRTCYNCGNVSHFVADCRTRRGKTMVASLSEKTRPSPSRGWCWERSISKNLPTITQDLSRRCIATSGESVFMYPCRPKAEAF